VNVTERNTGRVMLGAGVSSAEGLMGSFNVSQANFAGTGNTVALAISTGSINEPIHCHIQILTTLKMGYLEVFKFTEEI
jgi:outer membrane protein assembly factor BamA